MKVDMETKDGKMFLKMDREDGTTIDLSGEPEEFKKLALAMLQIVAGAKLEGRKP